MFNPIRFTRNIYEQLKAIRVEIKALRRSIMVLNRILERICNLDDSARESALWAIVDYEDSSFKDGTCTSTTVYGDRCCLPYNHSGDCNFRCEDPDCPGYPWPATFDRPHPTSTCKRFEELFPEMCNAIKCISGGNFLRCELLAGHSVPHRFTDKKGNVFKEDLNQIDDDNNGRCKFMRGDYMCILRPGHSGEHKFICFDRDCPGYPWISTPKNPHPASTCKCPSHPTMISRSAALRSTDQPEEEDQSR